MPNTTTEARLRAAIARLRSDLAETRAHRDALATTLVDVQRDREHLTERRREIRDACLEIEGQREQLQRQLSAVRSALEAAHHIANT
jgi:chromosome segregation ATPase